MDLFDNDTWKLVVQATTQCFTFARDLASPDEVSDWLHSHNGMWQRAQQAVGLQMGLFAYLEHAKDQDAGRWLVYLSQHRQHKHPELPYFGEYPDRPWQPTPDWMLKAKAFRLVRHDEASRSEPLFSRALSLPRIGNHEEIAKDKIAAANCLSRSELDGRFIYAPCGEMTASILGWFLRRLPQSLQVGLKSSAAVDFRSPILICEDSFESSLSQSWNPDLWSHYVQLRPQSLYDLFFNLGLQFDPPSPRLRNLVRWLHDLVVEKERPFSLQALKCLVPLNQHDPNFKDFLKIRTLVDERKPVDGLDVCRTVAQLLLRSTMTSDEWRDQCRFTLPGHYYLRAKETFERSWIAMPCHADADTSLYDGFLLGTLGCPKNANEEIWYHQSEKAVKEQIRMAQGLIAGISRYFNDVIYERIRIREVKLGAVSDTLTDDVPSDLTRIKIGDRTIVTADPTMRKIFEYEAPRLAESDLPVLIQGQTGTGKELVARAIHYYQHGNHDHFVAVNCGAINDEIAESELFGSKPGAFTGATDRAGFFETAKGGTIFLDEIGDLPLRIQVKLLRVLEEKEVVRLGSTEPIKVDVRVLAATKQDLEEMIRTGRFRDDLYYRIAGAEVYLPLLQERGEDIPFLAHFFVEANLNQNQSVSIGSDFLEHLKKHTWPGNVREFKDYIKKALQFRAGDMLTAEMAPEFAGHGRKSSTGAKPIGSQSFPVLVKATVEHPEDVVSALPPRPKPFELKNCAPDITPVEHADVAHFNMEVLRRNYFQGAPDSRQRASDELAKMLHQMRHNAASGNSIRLCCPRCGLGSWESGSDEANAFLNRLAELFNLNGSAKFPIKALARLFFPSGDVAYSKDIDRLRNWIKRVRKAGKQ